MKIDRAGQVLLFALRPSGAKLTPPRRLFHRWNTWVGMRVVLPHSTLHALLTLSNALSLAKSIFIGFMTSRKRETLVHRHLFHFCSI